MGQIGRWIDARCAEEPEVMRRVLNRKFGDLTYFISDGGACGCLVGSWMIVRHEPGTYPADTVARNIGVRVLGLTQRSPKILSDGTGLCSLGRKRPDAFVVRLVKQRIRKALGITPAVRETCAAVSA